MRLQRYLSRSGSAPSRRKAERMILSGRVRVNGRVAAIGEGVEPSDTVELDGERVELPAEHSYLVLNKPAGYLTTLADEPGRDRPTVAGLVPEVPGLVPVGRLDAETTGLLLFTNDGELAHRITHPSSEVEKEYLVTVSGSIHDTTLRALAAGPDLDDGPMRPPEIRGVAGSHLSTTFLLTIHEGRKRIIRRACAAVGLEVVSLHRLRVGPVSIGDLAAGEHRALYGGELERMP